MKIPYRWFREVSSEYPEHMYLLDSTKSRCSSYRVNVDGSWIEKAFKKPLKFDARKRTFVEVK